MRADDARNLNSRYVGRSAARRDLFRAVEPRREGTKEGFSQTKLDNRARATRIWVIIDGAEAF